MSNLTDEIYDKLVDMFNSEGWVYFIEDVRANLETANTLDGVQGEQALGMQQGRVDILRGIINYENTIKQVRDELDTEQTEQQSAEQQAVSL